MVNQGFWGAIEQYWTVDEKARLSRKNTYFEDCKLSNYDSFIVGIVATFGVITIVILAMVGVMV